LKQLQTFRQTRDVVLRRDAVWCQSSVGYWSVVGHGVGLPKRYRDVNFAR